MSESKYWIQVIEWLNKNDLIFAFHNSHKSELMNNYKEWINSFEKKYGRSIPVHSIKIKNSYSDFLVLKFDEFEEVYYIYSYEVKGEVGRAGFNRGIIQAENSKEGIDYSVLLIPKQSVKNDYERELLNRGILLGEIDEEGNITIRNESYARSSFRPQIHNRILKFLLIIKQKKEGEIISRIRSTKTIFLHYLVPGFLKYLYKKYENIELTSYELKSKLKTHWGQLIKGNNWSEIIDGKIKVNQITFKSWNDKTIKDFIKVSKQFGFMTKNFFFFSCIELYLDNIEIPILDFFLDIQNIQIRNKIIALYYCAEDMAGRDKWLYQKHDMLSKIILNFLSTRTDMKIFNKWIKHIMKTSSSDEGTCFRDIVDYVSRDNFSLMKEFFLKESTGKRSSEKDICISPIGKISCPFGTNERCYGKKINEFNDLLNFNEEIISRISDPYHPIESYEEIPKKYHENDDKKRPLRYGFIKALADMQFFYNFKRNIINLGYFPRNFNEKNTLLKKYNYPIGNDTSLGNYCPFLDQWSIDLENDAINF